MDGSSHPHRLKAQTPGMPQRSKPTMDTCAKRQKSLYSRSSFCTFSLSSYLSNWVKTVIFFFRIDLKYPILHTCICFNNCFLIECFTYRSFVMSPLEQTTVQMFPLIQMVNYWATFVSYTLTSDGMLSPGVCPVTHIFIFCLDTYLTPFYESFNFGKDSHYLLFLS